MQVSQVMCARADRILLKTDIAIKKLPNCREKLAQNFFVMVTIYFYSRSHCIRLKRKTKLVKHSVCFSSIYG